MHRYALLLATLLAGLVWSVPVAADITTGLVAHWPFSGSAQDVSGNANHGTVFGAVLTTDQMGTPNSAYQFDGLSSRIDVPSSVSLASPTTEITLAAWIRRDGWGMVGQLYNPILTKSVSGPNAFQYRFITSTSGLSTAFNSWLESAGVLYTFDVDVWYHVASTWKGDSLRSYVNGVLVETDYFPVTITPDTRTLSIGSDIPGVLEIFCGTIDEVRIYSRALSDADIAELVASTVSTPLHDATRQGVALGRAYPNPMHPATIIPFTLPSSMTVTLDIIDVTGRHVRTLVDRQELSAGLNASRWDGRDAGGHLVKSGVYFYRLVTPGNRQAKKIFIQR